MGDKDSKAGLGNRVAALGVNTKKIKRVEISPVIELPTTEFLNKPGQSLSMQIYEGIKDKKTSTIGEREARIGLRDLYGRQLRQETAAGANHPGVSLLEGIASGILPPIKVNAIEHNELEFLPKGRAVILREVAEEFGTPSYVYFEDALAGAYKKFTSIPAPFGKKIRLAAKANTSGAILRWFYKAGSEFDACTVEEAERINHWGIPLCKIRLVSKQVPDKSWLKKRVAAGLRYTAASLKQLENFGMAFPGSKVGIRFNIGIGSGFSPQTSTGGLGSPFGIYEKRKEIDTILEKYGLILDTVHYHIGAGSDPKKQEEALARGFDIVRDYPTVDTLDTGGSFKVRRTRDETGTDMRKMGKVMVSAFRKFYQETGRRIRLETEPGTALLANSGYIVLQAIDKVDTGEKGETFIVTDGGTNLNSRIPMYGAQHPIYSLGNSRKKGDVIIVGPQCESGDVLTVRRGQPEVMDTRRLRIINTGDYLAVAGSGAYCGSSMTLKHYNSLPDVPQIFARTDGSKDLIRKRQELADLWKDEIIPEDLK